MERKSQPPATQAHINLAYHGIFTHKSHSPSLIVHCTSPSDPDPHTTSKKLTEYSPAPPQSTTPGSINRAQYNGK